MTSTTKTARKAAAPKASDLLQRAGALAYASGEGRAKAKEETATAIDLAIAGLDGATLRRSLAFDVRDKSGQVIRSARVSLLEWQRGSAEFKNEQGGANRMAQSAFRAKVLETLCNTKDDKGPGANAVWTLFNTAAPAAVALADEGIRATLGEDGKLALTGGKGAQADALKAAAAQSTAALRKVAAGETGTQGGTDKGGPREATAAEVIEAALVVARKVAKGEEALAGTALSRMREIARIVTMNPDTFGAGL